MTILAILITSNLIFSQNWGVDTTASYIKYTGNHTLHSWEGISKNIDFSMKCEGNICELFVSTPLESLNSGNDSRDSNMLYYTESLSYPKVSFKSNKFKFTGNFDTSIDILGIIDFHGIKKEIPINVNLSRENNSYWGICKFNINLNSFKVERPSLLMIKISEIIEIETKFNIVKIEK